MKYADFVTKDTSVNMMNCIAKATKGCLDVRDARSAVNVFDKDGGAPHNSCAAIHDYCPKKRKGMQGGGSVALQVERRTFGASDAHL